MSVPRPGPVHSRKADAASNGTQPTSSWDGAEYERISALQRGVGLAFIETLELDGAHRILDVGCGDGYLTEKIAQKITEKIAQNITEGSQANVVGVDSSPAMIARARERESDRLTFAESDVSTMRFDQSFDLIVSLNTLHWVPDLPGAFARLFAAQAAGGRIVCQLVGASDVPSVEDVTVMVTEGQDWRSYFREGFRPYVHPTQDALRGVAEGAGYRLVETSTWTERFAFQAEEHFRRWCAAGMSVWTNRIPEARRAAFIDEVTNRYSDRHGVSPEFEFSQLRLSAQR